MPIDRPDSFVPVASFLPTLANVEAVQEALDRAGVDFLMEGSRVYEIRVRPEDAEKALGALRSSSASSDITVVHGGGSTSLES